MACSWFPHCYCSAGGTSWGWLSCLNWGSMLLPQGGSEHDERTLCCAHCRPSPRAHSITPCQEDALGQGSMSWEEAELHKCTLIDPLNPPAGKQTPPIYSPKQQSTSLLPAGTHRERGEVATGTWGPITVHQVCLLYHHPGGKPGQGAGTLGCFKPRSFLCGAEE